MRKQQKQIWIYGIIHMKTVISFKKKECNVRYYKNNLLFTFKGSKYAINILFLSIFFADFWKY